VLVERYENNLYGIDTALRDAGIKGGVEIRACLADILDEGRMERIFEEHRPDLVFHAAAHKHVPIVEENPAEGVLNNILGTYRVAVLSGKFSVDRMILVSTDKAVNPTNVMGATKRWAEYIVRSLSGSGTTRFITVRFGNVLGSNGSVVPRFQQQIERGGPVTVTHREIERYFMLIPEAVHLVLEAAQRGEGGEVFVLDMGEPVKIVDLAQNMIRLAGYAPYDDIAIEFTGLRPGEKLFEELFDQEERVERTSHPKLRKAISESVWSKQDLASALTAVVGALERRGGECLQDVLQRFMPSYQPTPVSVADGQGASNGVVRSEASVEVSTAVSENNGHRPEAESLPSLIVSDDAVDDVPFSTERS
jgi:FlaA1/EpsC-like NDP-sugar epimerase